MCSLKNDSLSTTSRSLNQVERGWTLNEISSYLINWLFHCACFWLPLSLSCMLFFLSLFRLFNLLHDNIYHKSYFYKAREEFSHELFTFCTLFGVQAAKKTITQRKIKTQRSWQVEFFSSFSSKEIIITQMLNGGGKHQDSAWLSNFQNTKKKFASRAGEMCGETQCQSLHLPCSRQASRPSNDWILINLFVFFAHTTFIFPPNETSQTRTTENIKNYREQNTQKSEEENIRCVCLRNH